MSIIYEYPSIEKRRENITREIIKYLHSPFISEKNLRDRFGDCNIVVEIPTNNGMECCSMTPEVAEWFLRRLQLEGRI